MYDKCQERGWEVWKEVPMMFDQILLSGYGELLDSEGRSGYGSSEFEIISDHVYLFEYRSQVAGNRDF